MDLKKDYPNLFQFFVGYFPDADFEDLTDEQIVANYVLKHNESNNHQKIDQLKIDIERLIITIGSYWQEVGDEANRYFEKPQDAVEWLIMIKKEMDS